MAVTFALPACRTEGLAFRQDHRLTIVAPDDRTTVSLPFRMRWRAHDVAVGPGEGRFAVFVDLDPPAPGSSLTDFARRDLSCRAIPECPDEQWFNTHGILLTRARSIDIEFLADRRPANRPRTRDRHRLTLIVLDERDRRVGETADDIEVFVDRPRR